MKPQDILVTLKILSLNEKAADGSAVWPQRLLAEETGLSLSEVNAACRRLQEAGILTSERRKVIRSSLLEFLIHSLKYVFPVTMGKPSRGMPTGYAAAPLRDMFLASEEEMPPVWPDADGPVRGMALKPLYKSVPMAARKDATLYEYLVLVDAIRGGRARERKAATDILKDRLG